MFDIGWTEMLVVAVVVILVVGPKELPGMLRTIGKTIGDLKRMAGDFQRQFSDALRESEIDELKKDLSGDIANATSIPNPLDDINASADNLLASIDADVDLDDDIVADVLSDKVSGTAVNKKPAKKVASKKPAAKRKPTNAKAAAAAPKKATPGKAVTKKPAARKPAAGKTAVKKPAVKRKATASGKTA